MTHTCSCGLYDLVF